MKLRELKSATGKIFLTTHVDERNNWVYNNWLGYVTPENVVQGSLAVLEMIEKYQVSYGLNDNRLLVGRWDHSVDWIEQVWTPRAAAAGLRYYAHVVNEDSFAAASSADMLSRVQGRFHMHIFQDIESAQQWLLECQAKNK
ncbi:hypothetical protein H9Q13_06835 [Pontibacter sp. JH31]|uniref:STAS/SEC14 domain-containing protein n=1 Tax=Pontibacter aquaedesilientis TaxID=2766980 RepID=A0ABR7XF03_9BACT|nr:hypothetical protein [Pontibacter aquaedesilientis]MBD1396874.1 hypothetical protein [Pontibacter aquaedesilientis]